MVDASRMREALGSVEVLRSLEHTVDGVQGVEEGLANAVPTHSFK